MYVCKLSSHVTAQKRLYERPFTTGLLGPRKHVIEQAHS